MQAFLQSQITPLVVEALSAVILGLLTVAVVWAKPKVEVVYKFIAATLVKLPGENLDEKLESGSKALAEFVVEKGLNK
jgi:hypothetical protein